ncbi:MAG: NRDE family protein [Porticoccaceae bacterium]|nr:NRDE family protein [Porticoccaceae bacterium]
MCLVTLAFQYHPRYPLIVVANRDEFYDRPTQPAEFWADSPSILAGRDLDAGGTWFGVDRRGNWATVTNTRGGGYYADKSRGGLPTGFLLSEADSQDYFDEVLEEGELYSGFNLLAGSAHELLYCTNARGGTQHLNPGIYTLSNDALDTPWPKSELARARLGASIEDDVLDSEGLLAVLGSRQTFADHLLPDTGLGIDMERSLSSPFIVGPSYGTRCTTVLLIDNQGKVEFAEQNFVQGKPLGKLRQYRFSVA